MLLLALLAGQALAQSFPSRPIRLIVPYGPGGAGDVVARTFAQKVSDNTGWSVLVENRPGAGGILAAEIVVKAQPDGHTLMLGGTAVLAINPSVYAKVPYDSIRDFSPVVQLVSLPLFLAVNAGLPVQSAKQLIDHARTNPGLNYGSTGAPRPVIDRLNREFNAALAAPDVAQRLAGLGFESIGGTPDQFGEAIRLEIEQFAKLVKATGAKAE
ncbi:MAG: hypothetical protein EXR27_07890 [Betaproteobacteria bacterium]|nr:hypothetical protein [Betaproteobacteria bacterium]